MYINYKYNLINRKPLIFLKDKNIDKLIRDVEEYFNLGYNFFKDAYSYYDIWFSFIDPAIRCNILEKVITNKHLNGKPGINSIGGEYFTFMSKEDRTEILEMLLKS